MSTSKNQYNKNMLNNTPKEGIELLYTRDCKHWPEALTNLKQAIKETGLTEEPTIMPVDTRDQAIQFNFFASPTIHIDGQDVDPHVRRTHKRGLGVERPYFYKGQTYTAPPVAMIIEAINEFYTK